MCAATETDRSQASLLTPIVQLLEVVCPLRPLFRRALIEALPPPRVAVLGANERRCAVGAARRWALAAKLLHAVDVFVQLGHLFLLGFLKVAGDAFAHRFLAVLEQFATLLRREFTHLLAELLSQLPALIGGQTRIRQLLAQTARVGQLGIGTNPAVNAKCKNCQQQDDTRNDDTITVEDHIPIPFPANSRARPHRECCAT
jgi:hypothetical protein